MRINKGRRTHTKRNLMKKIRRKPFKWWSRKEQVRLFVLGSSQSRRCVTPEAMRGRASMMHNVLPESIGIRSRQKRRFGLTALLLCLNMLSMIRLHSVQELLTTCRVPNVLHTQADTLLDVSVSNDVVYNDTNGMRCNVVHDACSAITYGICECIILVVRSNIPVVVFVGHTPLLCGVSLNIDNVSYTVIDEVGGHFDGAMICKQNMKFRSPILDLSNGLIVPLKPRLNMWRVRAR